MLKILKKLCSLKPVLHNVLWLRFVHKNFDSTLRNNAITIKITHKMFDVWEVFVLFLVLQQLKSSECLSRGADERKAGIFFIATRTRKLFVITAEILTSSFAPGSTRLGKILIIV